MFNDRYGLTAAVLEGNKTMTRRVINGDYTRCIQEYCGRINGKNIYKFYGETTPDEELVSLRPMYKIGETVAVAQSYQDAGYPPKTIQRGRAVRQGSYPDLLWDNSFIGQLHDWFIDQLAGWNNKMFVSSNMMKHHICITDIKIELLQDISDEDCLKEGVLNCQQQGVLVIENHAYFIPAVYCHKIFCFKTPRAAFAYLFDHISGQGTWERNPYVVVYEFVCVKI